MFTNRFYHGITRKTIVAFGHLFSNIFVERREGSSTKGPKIQALQVPIAYGPKEKWLTRIDQDPSLENHTYTTLPRMAFEITNYMYDPTRKLNKMQKLICNSDGESKTMFTPVPYNIDISLYILTKTQEDGLQILEQILPTFAPEYTLSINAVPEMNIVQDIPVMLTSVSVSDDYEGDFAMRRSVTHTLTFTLKTNIYGPVTTGKPIYHVAANVGLNSNTDTTSARYSASGDPDTYAVIDEQWLEGF